LNWTGYQGWHQASQGKQQPARQSQQQRQHSGRSSRRRQQPAQQVAVVRPQGGLLSGSKAGS
jgi:hypothetical protein